MPWRPDCSNVERVYQYTWGNNDRRGGEVDAIEEVRLRMPMRAVGGEVVSPGGASDAPTLLIGSYLDAPALLPALESFHRLGRRVLVDSDANVFAGDGHLVVRVDDVATQSMATAPPHTAKRWRRKYLELVRAADAVTVTSPQLAAVYRQQGARRVLVIPNAIDPAQWPDPPVRKTGAFTVGVACGPGHDRDLQLIRPALEWASRQDGVEVVVFGGWLDRELCGLPLPFAFRYQPGRTPWPAEWRRFRWRHLPFTTSYAEYRATLSGLFDVGLMPLTDTAYNRCRSDLRVCEYAMAGALPVVSDAANYAEWKSTTVLFAQDAGGFREQVEWAVTHQDEARERAAAVRAAVLERRTIEQTAPLWRAAVRDPFDE